MSASEISAEWVLPLDGPPIEGGSVQFENGVITHVGPGRAKRHFADAVLLPGFVNAHSHLEYAAYAGFGDGVPFPSWLETHVERKRMLELADMLALARRGAADSLATGITTTADYSFSGAAATAAGELGLRAIVYLEVFAVDPGEAERQFAETRARVAEASLVRIGVSPHAPYTCSLDVYRWCLSLGIPVGTHLAESANEHEWLQHGTGQLELLGSLLVPPTGKRSVGTLEPVLGPELLVRPLRRRRARGDRAARRARRPDRPLPTLERPARLRDRAAHGLPRRRAPSRPGHRLAGLHAVVRHVRGAARRRLSRPRCIRPSRGLDADAALRLATVDAARALRLDDQVGTLTPGKHADLTVVSLAGSPYHPVEDPAAAVVFGGSPERVLVTLVEGETRYTSEDKDTWREVRSTASAARERMLAPRRP